MYSRQFRRFVGFINSRKFVDTFTTGLDYWATSFTGADRLIIDTHPYVAFNGQPNLAPVDTGTGPGAGGVWPAMACGWGGAITTRCFEVALELLFQS